MEPEGSLPQSKEYAACPYPELDQPRPCQPSHFIKIQFIVPSMPRPCKWTLPSGFPHLILVYTCPLLFRHTCHMSCPFCSSWFDYPIICGGECRPYCSSLCSLAHSPVISFLLGSGIFLSTLFLNTQPVFLPHCGRQSFTHILQNSMQNYYSL